MPAKPVVSWRDGWETLINHPGHRALPELVTARGACWPTVVQRHTGGRTADGARAHETAGACLGCGWIGVAHRTGADGIGPMPLAVADAHDHSHPAWRTVPAVGPRREGWADQVRHAYPAGWWETGGPVVMIDGPRGLYVDTEGAPGGYGGYSLAAILRGEISAAAPPESVQGELF